LQTSETALLFLQYIMRKLRVAGFGAEKGGRAAVVVPNGTLFGEGVSAAIKKQLIEEFNLHTIVRLPQGVFAPYTDIPANLLFFDRNGITQDLWYYEVPLPEGRKKYSKTAPMQYEEFGDCLAWWNDRREDSHAWKTTAQAIARRGYNLDLKNPNAKQEVEHVDPVELVARMRAHEGEIVRLLDEIERLVGGAPA
jgi:type I restriction enzyme M protein